MKKLFTILSLACAMAVGCEEYDHTPIWDKLNEHEERLLTLEELCKQFNTNIGSLQDIVAALQKNDYVTNVVAIVQGNKEIGYTIHFSESGPVTIYHGNDGANGQDGKPGTDGVNGTDGHTPIVGLKKAEDGLYYWTIDGQWLTDDEGNMIPATGKDGADGANGADGQPGQNGTDGQPGADGKDGVTPQLKIEEGYWYVSYDNGASWTQLGKATGEDGENGAPGQDGNHGEDGDSMFKDVEVSADYVIITLAGGTQFKIPTWKAFEDLQTRIDQINTNVASLQTMVLALQNNDYVTSVVPFFENGKEAGYSITFSKSGVVTIYHGKDGKDGVDGAPGQDGAAGAPGQNGADGADGADGEDGATPVIGVKKDADGKYYWTLNGSWLLDEAGNKVPTTGADGKDGVDGTPGQDGAAGTPGQNGSNGSDGTDGKDGVTPKLKIEDGYWFVSYDNGATWTQLGKATGEDAKDGEDGEDGAPGQDGKPGTPGQNGTDGKDGVDGDSFFQSVDTANTDFVLITLADGTQIKLPTWKAFSELQALVNQVNTNVASLQTLVAALENNDYVKSVTNIMENGKVVGYTITFSKSDPVTIYHGKDGKDGVDGAPGQDGATGAPGQNGTDGEDGEDGTTPVIGVKKDTDGKYYWTLNGSWLLDEAGNKVPTTGADGKDGVDGTPGQDGAAGTPGQNGSNGSDGKDGVTPKLKIENNHWFVSYDNGATWTQLGKATGEDGAPGQDGQPGTPGQNGTDGKDGVDGDSFFQSVDTANTDFVLITLADGTQIKLPTWKAFEELQTLVNQINGNVASLQTIVSALENKDYVLDVTPIYENSKGIGYIITFSKSGKVTIYHGKDGQDGAPGQNGSNGINGTDGIDGKTPVIGVQKDTDGKYYWTVDGTWLLDDAGNKIPTTGADGKDGNDGTPGTNGNDGATGQPGVAGTPGKDGVTPKLDIVDGYWYVSYDNGETWTPLGKATGEDGAPGQDGKPGADGKPGEKGDSMFQDVDYTETTVTFTLADGTELQVPLITNGVAVELVSCDEFSAYFEGTVAKRAVDFKVTIYYSTSSNISLYNYFNCVSVTSATNGSFALQIDKLYSKTKYYYFIETVNNGKTSYTGVEYFTTEAVTGYETQFDITSCTDLATDESANCYIVTAPGTYRIPAVKGNGSTSVGSVTSVDVLWESFGTSSTPARGSLVKGALYDGGYVYFKTNDNFSEGNAVIAAKNSAGTVLWSWHIWMTDQPKGQVYYRGAGTMMDRNLGATDTTPGSVKALGLLYQWGRKDPFMGSSSISSIVEAKSTISFPTPVVSTATVGTVDWAIENPTTLIMGGTTNKWMYVQDKTLWATDKTIYDPCPAGWKMPEAGENGVWCKAAGGIRINADLFDDVNKGVNLSGYVGSDKTIWYPATGYYGKANGVFYGVGKNASYHSCTLDSYGYLCFVINSTDTYLYLLNLSDFGGAEPVRCIKE